MFGTEASSLEQHWGMNALGLTGKQPAVDVFGQEL
jgi:hypothetical protein